MKKEEFEYYNSRMLVFSDREFLFIRSVRNSYKDLNRIYNILDKLDVLYDKQENLFTQLDEKELLFDQMMANEAYIDLLDYFKREKEEIKNKINDLSKKKNKLDVIKSTGDSLLKKKLIDDLNLDISVDFDEYCNDIDEVYNLCEGLYDSYNDKIKDIKSLIIHYKKNDILELKNDIKNDKQLLRNKKRSINRYKIIYRDLVTNNKQLDIMIKNNLIVRQ